MGLQGSSFLCRVYKVNIVPVKELVFFVFRQLVKYHQLHPFDSLPVKGKRQNSNQRYAIIISYWMFDYYEKKHFPTTCGSCNAANQKDHAKHSEWRKATLLHCINGIVLLLDESKQQRSASLCVSAQFNSKGKSGCCTERYSSVSAKQPR